MGNKIMGKRIRYGLMVGLLAVPGFALAQWDAGSTADLGAGYGQTALGQSTLSNTRKIDGKRKNHLADDDARLGHGAGGGVPTLSPERQRALVQEYERRLRTDGRASADAWAYEMGRRDAEARRRAEQRR